MTVEQALLKGKSHQKKGELDQARVLYKAVIDAFPNNELAKLALATLDQSKTSVAPAVPNPSKEQVDSLIALYSAGRTQDVIAEGTILVEEFSSSFVLWNILGAAYKSVGLLENAADAFAKAGELNPNSPEAHNNLGVVLKDQGKFDDALAAYERALALKPDYAVGYFNMGNALKDQGKFDDAIAAYKRALALKPDYADAYNNMGNALKNQGKLDDAIAAYERALALKPDYADAWSNVAELLEKWNKLKELDLWLERACQTLKPIPSDIIFMKAKLLWRNKNAQGAIKLIASIDFETMRPERKQDYFNLKAKCHEEFNEYDLAYSCYENMNSLAVKSNNYSVLQPQEYFKNILDRLAILNSKALGNPLNYTADKPDVVPVFLVGFPRSGTTLLDTILRSHSSIEVVEEQPAVASAKAFVKKSGYSDIEDVLPENVIAGARKAYITELNKHRETVDKDSVLIDKLPLNLLDVPVIQQLYPQAKFVLALRHPLDTILSCWMQNFKLNNAMANMVDLDRVVDFYCVAMDTFRICRARYNLNVHEIRYEDLLEDLRGEISALLKFLDLDWEAQMEKFPETALKRGRINTPSYSQVVQPIYKDAKYKWLNYQKHLEQYFIKVEPWINEFNYTAPRKLP